MSIYLDTLYSLSRDDWFFLGLLAAMTFLSLLAAFHELSPRRGRRYRSTDF